MANTLTVFAHTCTYARDILPDPFSKIKDLIRQLPEVSPADSIQLPTSSRKSCFAKDDGSFLRQLHTQLEAEENLQKKEKGVLGSSTQWLDHWLMDRRVTGSILIKGIYLNCRLDSQL